MSADLTFKIPSQLLKPIVEYDDLKILFDTGADTPVWCSGLRLFIKKFPYATKENYRFLLSGFGRSRDEMLDLLKNLDNSKESFLVDVYSIPEFSLQSGGQQITWKNLRVAVTNREFSGVNLILPCTMFRGMVLRICQGKKATEIEIISPGSVANVDVNVLETNLGKLLCNIYGQDAIDEVLGTGNLAATPDMMLEGF